jgi:hypothetical protein
MGNFSRNGPNRGLMKNLFAHAVVGNDDPKTNTGRPHKDKQ